MTSTAAPDATIEQQLRELNDALLVSSVRLRSVMSIKQLIAPVSSPRWFLSGLIFTSTVIREPSGRSICTSASRNSDILPLKTSAIGH